VFEGGTAAFASTNQRSRSFRQSPRRRLRIGSHKARAGLRRRFQVNSDQLLFRALPPHVSPQRAENHARLPAVLRLGEASAQTSACSRRAARRSSGVICFRHAPQDGFVRRLQLLFRALQPPHVSPQRAEDHACLPAVLRLGDAARFIPLQDLLNLFNASSLCHAASVGRFGHPHQDGFVGRLRTIKPIGIVATIL
jgi:hypothetical protein